MRCSDVGLREQSYIDALQPELDRAQNHAHGNCQSHRRIFLAPQPRDLLAPVARRAGGRGARRICRATGKYFRRASDARCFHVDRARFARTGAARVERRVRGGAYAEGDDRGAAARDGRALCVCAESDLSREHRARTRNGRAARRSLDARALRGRFHLSLHVDRAGGGGLFAEDFSGGICALLRACAAHDSASKRVGGCGSGDVCSVGDFRRSTARARAGRDLRVYAVGGVAPGVGGFLGRRKMMLVPRPTSLSACTLPPCARTMCFTIERPRPVPPCSRLRPLSAR